LRARLTDDATAAESTNPLVDEKNAFELGGADCSRAGMAEHDRDGEDLVFGRTGTEAFFASTIRARANKPWRAPAWNRSPRTRPSLCHQLPTVAHTVAQAPENDETPVDTGVLKYRYRDSKPAPEE
jgi:hypothetical protein